jgi:hypothetical protein
MVVWERRVRAARDRHVEREAVRALFVQRLLEPPGHVSLGATHDPLADQPFVDGLRNACRSPDLLELLGFLDRAQPLHDPVRGDELET